MNQYMYQVVRQAIQKECHRVFEQEEIVVAPEVLVEDLTKAVMNALAREFHEAT
jgi:hypothetical protein